MKSPALGANRSSVRRSCQLLHSRDAIALVNIDDDNVSIDVLPPPLRLTSTHTRKPTVRQSINRLLINVAAARRAVGRTHGPHTRRSNDVRKTWEDRYCHRARWSSTAAVCKRWSMTFGWRISSDRQSFHFVPMSNRSSFDARAQRQVKITAAPVHEWHSDCADAIDCIPPLLLLNQRAADVATGKNVPGGRGVFFGKIGTSKIRRTNAARFADISLPPLRTDLFDAARGRCCPVSRLHRHIIR